MYEEKPDWVRLKEAIETTATKRNSLQDIKKCEEIMKDICESNFLRNAWKRYQLQNKYAQKVVYEDIMKSIYKLIDRLYS